jgi:polyhydroxyalkanoate synthase subunit PhaC
MATHAENANTRQPQDAVAGESSFGGDPSIGFTFSTCFRIAYQGGKLRLLHYAPVGPARRTPILFVYALIKRAFILDLAPDRSVVEKLARQGFHVYLTDWIPPTDAESWRGLDAYVNTDLASATSVVMEERGTKQVSVIGYCQGALLGVIYAALHPRQVRNVVALTMPLEMSAAAALVPAWLSAQTVELIIGLYGNCPAWIFNAFSSMRLMAGLEQFRKEICGSDGRGEVFERFLDWMGSDIPLAGRIFREVAIKIFGQNQLVRGELLVGDRAVELGRITCPLLNVTARFDDLVPPRACAPLANLVSSRDTLTLVFPSTHVGVAAGIAAHEKLWPAVGQWLSERDSHCRDSTSYAEPKVQEKAKLTSG